MIISIYLYINNNIFLYSLQDKKEERHLNCLSSQTVDKAGCI